jgi:hypothetical protein
MTTMPLDVWMAWVETAKCCNEHDPLESCQ